MTLHVLDSTDPGAILATERAVDLSKTLFLVSSKSGGTIETLSQFKHFHARVREAVGDDEAGSHFVAITDPGSELAELADEHDFRRAVPERPGHRRPLLGAVVLRDRAGGADGRRRRQAARGRPGGRAGVRELRPLVEQLGPLAGLRARRAGAARAATRLTFAVAEPIGSFGLWVEQLIAESLGKQGRGALPVAGEPLGAPDAYGDDRVFVHLQQKDAPEAGLRDRDEGPGQGRPPGAHARRRRRRTTSAGSSSSRSSRRPSRAGCSRSTRSTSRTCRRPRTPTKALVLEAAASCRTSPDAERRRAARAARRGAAAALRGDPGLRRSRPTSSTRRSTRCAWRSGTRPRRRRRSATGRATCTRPASSTRAARRPGVFLQLDPRRRRGRRDPGGAATRSAR